MRTPEKNDAFRSRSGRVPVAFRSRSGRVPVAFRSRSGRVPVAFRSRSGRVPVAFRNKCERDRNANRDRCEHGHSLPQATLHGSLNKAVTIYYNLTTICSSLYHLCGMTSSPKSCSRREFVERDIEPVMLTLFTAISSLP